MRRLSCCRRRRCAICGSPSRRGGAGWLSRGALSLAFALFTPQYVGRLLYDNAFMERFNIVVSVSSMADTYYRSGFVTGFCMMTKTLMGEQAPKGYSEQAVEQALLRFPHMMLGVEATDTAFRYRPNVLPPVVLPFDGVEKRYTIGSKDTRGYMFLVGYDDHTITME